MISRIFPLSLLMLGILNSSCYLLIRKITEVKSCSRVKHFYAIKSLLWLTFLLIFVSSDNPGRLVQRESVGRAAQCGGVS